MEQSKFILEVQSRQCIWNPRVTTYLDRFLKRQAWEEIAAKMYWGFHSCSEHEKTAKVRELQKKWKSLKDYYKRRNPKEDIDEKTNQKKPIVELLQFLDDVTTLNHHINSQARFENQNKNIKNKNIMFQLPDYEITVKKFNDSQPLKSRKRRQRNLRCPIPSLDKQSQQNEEMKFLQSLLPVMQSLNDRQRFDFKLQVMMLLKKIKYEEIDDTCIQYTGPNTNVAHQNDVVFHTPTPEIERAPWPIAPLTF